MSTYFELQASIIDVLGDRTLNTGDAQKFIALAEPKLERDLLSPNYGGGVPRQMMATVSGTVAAGNEYALPTDYIAARSVKVNDQRVRYSSPELLNRNAQGIENSSVVVDYYQRLPVLTNQNISNWLLDAAYDLYMWGAALQYAAWGQEQDTVKIWGDYYNDAMATVKAAYKPNARGNLYRHPNRLYNGFYAVIGTNMIFGNAVR